MIELIPTRAGVSWQIDRMLRIRSRRRFALAMLLWSLAIKTWTWAAMGDGVLIEIHVREREVNR